MPSAMVTFNGRITLPPNVRKQLGLRTGDCVEFVELGNGRFAIATNAARAERAVTSPQGWVPQLELSSVEEEPRFDEELFEEKDELIQ
jgi:AbrB family looped-hinge helix DNA binding protein